MDYLFNESVTVACPSCPVKLNLSAEEETGRLAGAGGKDPSGDVLSNVTSNDQFLASPVSDQSLPAYTLQGIWWLIWLVALEYVALWWQGARLPDLHDNILSLVHATLYEVSRVFVRGLEYSVYVWIWKHFSFFPYPDDTLFSFIVLVVSVDFAFYWMHRAGHEIMVLWSIHQVHHSAEEFSMAVGLRHSPLQRLFSWMFYLPLAFFGIPPSHMLAHVQFNLLFQCWTHTEAISTVGPLEYVFNTPSHHRVHHGCNKYCLDKNYGGIFIVWDRLFGTFQKELPDQEIAYGIVFQPPRFNPLYHQVFYFMGALGKAKSMSSWADSFCALIKGPSWVPGSPWTGFDRDKQDIKGPRNHVPVSSVSSTHCYVIVHFLAALFLTSYLIPNTAVGPTESFLYGLMVVMTLTSIGILYENSPHTRLVEICRCVSSLALCLVVPSTCQLVLSSFTTIYAASLILWILTPATIMGHKRFNEADSVVPRGVSVALYNIWACLTRRANLRCCD